MNSKESWLVVLNKKTDELLTLKKLPVDEEYRQFFNDKKYQ